MKKVTLTPKENEIYQQAKAAAKACGDNGYEFIMDDLLSVEPEIKVLRGYLGQLTKKGLLDKFEDCYFDFGVVELIPECHRYSECNYDFNIIIK